MIAGKGGEGRVERRNAFGRINNRELPRSVLFN